MRTAKEMSQYCIHNNYSHGSKEKRCIQHFSIIEKQLDTDEIVKACFMVLFNYVSPFSHDGIYACAVTNERLIFAQKKLIGENYKSIELNKIINVNFESRIYGRLEITVANTIIKVCTMKNAIQELQKQIHINTNPYNTSESTNISYNNKNSNSNTKIETHHVTGTSHYKENIMSLSYENDDYELTKKEIVENYLYDERIYQYDWNINKIELVEEPDNPFDKNAIKVIFDDVLVGYIKKGSCTHIKKLLHLNKILSYEAKVGGGKYKYVYQDDDTDNWIMDKSSTDLFISIQLKIKDE